MVNGNLYRMESGSQEGATLLALLSAFCLKVPCCYTYTFTYEGFDYTVYLCICNGIDAASFALMVPRCIFVSTWVSASIIARLDVKTAMRTMLLQYMEH